MTTRGLVLDARTLVAKFDGLGDCLADEDQRAATLLSVAWRHEASHVAIDVLQRVAKHWRSGDKCLAAIHLAQSGLPEIDLDSAYQLALAEALLDAGLSPRRLAQELGLDLDQPGVSKYDENQPRTPPGNGRESGRWTSAGGAGSAQIEGRSAGTAPGGINRVLELPKDAIVVTLPDGTTIRDPDSPAGKLMAPPRADLSEVYAAGRQLAPILPGLDYLAGKTALEHFGTYDFQRDKEWNTWFKEYADVSNYAVGVFMAGAGYGRDPTVIIAQTYAYFRSINSYDERAIAWTRRGWDDAHRGLWR